MRQAARLQLKREPLASDRTMPPSPSESEWRTFRAVRDHALERFCEHVLAEVRTSLDLTSQSFQERYATIFQLLKDRDQEMATAFDDPRRSHMLQQLVTMRRHGLLEPDELAQFSPETRTTVELSLKEHGG
jgi:peroxiredoxin